MNNSTDILRSFSACRVTLTIQKLRKMFTMQGYSNHAGWLSPCLHGDSPCRATVFMHAGWLSSCRGDHTHSYSVTHHAGDQPCMQGDCHHAGVIIIIHTGWLTMQVTNHACSVTVTMQGDTLKCFHNPPNTGMDYRLCNVVTICLLRRRLAFKSKCSCSALPTILLVAEWKQECFGYIWSFRIGLQCCQLQIFKVRKVFRF